MRASKLLPLATMINSIFRDREEIRQSPPSVISGIGAVMMPLRYPTREGQDIGGGLFRLASPSHLVSANAGGDEGL